MKHSVRLEQPIPNEIKGDLLAKLHYVSEDLAGFAFRRDSLVEIDFDLRPAAQAEPREVGRRIQEVAKKMCAGYRPAVIKTLARQIPDAFAFQNDPHPLLQASGNLFRYGNGRFGLGPMPTRLVEIFDADCRRLAQQFEAPPHQFPALIGADTLDKCKYFTHFPHSLTFATHLREDFQSIRDFAATAKWESDGLTISPAWLSRVECLLGPSVCFHYYAALEKKHVENGSITAVGKCFRYESGNLAGLERLWDFSMREIIFVGSPEFVLAERQRSIDLSQELLRDWGISYEICTATDPFFVDGFAAQVNFQSAFDLKFEIRAPLPYKGSTLAIGSFNYHQDYFGRCFEISDDAGRARHTGCAGFGLERLALAFLAQHGTDPQRWPESMKRRYRERK